MVFFTSAYHSLYMTARQLVRGGIFRFPRIPCSARATWRWSCFLIQKCSSCDHTPGCSGGPLRWTNGFGNGDRSDVLSGENVKAATKRRASVGSQQAKQDALTEVKRRREPSITTTNGKKKRWGDRIGRQRAYQWLQFPLPWKWNHAPRSRPSSGTKRMERWLRLVYVGSDS